MTDEKKLFVPGGPERYAHQKRGLRKIIETRGVCALLYDPGLGKTATTLDFASILALKSGEFVVSFGRPAREARILVVAPLAAIDTWVLQAPLWVSPDVNFWAEAIGGSREQRAEIIAARGGQPFKPKKGSRKNRYAPRALHVDKSLAWAVRAEGRESNVPVSMSEGPDGLGTAKPRIVLLATNFDTFSSRQAVKGSSKSIADHLLEAVKRFNPDLVVVDEAHKIKSPTSNVSRLLGRIGEISPRRLALTGTIMPASPLDVFGVWRFVEPYAFGELLSDGTRKRATFAAFKDKYAVMGGYMGREVKGFKNLDEMQTIMAQNASVARKRDALPDLPKDKDVEVPILLTPRELQAYNEMKKGLAAQLQAGGLQTSATAGSRLTQILRLRQITSGHLPDDNGNLHVLGDSKVDAIDSVVNDTLAGEDRVVVFCYFVHEIHALKQRLERKGTEIMTIDGDTPGDDRIAMRKKFGDRKTYPGRIVMIAQIRTMSLAVNELVTASHAVFGSLPQTRDDIIQARDRLNRIGQVLPTTFWFVLAPGTIDTVIFKSYKEKTSLEAAVLAHILDLDPMTASEQLEIQDITEDLVSA